MSDLHKEVREATHAMDSRDVLPRLSRILRREDALEVMVRAHDAEEAAQKGEPSLWAIYDRGDFASDSAEDVRHAEWEVHKAERLSAMRAALKAVGLA